MKKYTKPKITSDELDRAMAAMAPSSFAIRAILDGVDHTASTMERTWGVGRLRLLVGDLMRAKFDAQAAKLDQAIASNLEAEVKRHGEAMVRAYEALDKAARQEGHRPLSPSVWEMVLPSTGEVVAIVRDAAEASLVRGQTVFTLGDLAALLDDETLRAVVAVKSAFPGAAVVGVNEVKPPAEGDFWARGGDVMPF